MNFRNLSRASLLLWLLLADAAFAEPMPEYQLKSAFIYNFATFIDWPDKIGKSLTLCVAAPQGAMKYFSLLEGKPVGNMKVAVRHLGEGDSAENCQILFVAESESDGFDDWLSEVGDEQVLTVSESEKWLKKGVMIDLLLQDKRIVFDVNMDAARDVGVVINSKLLRLARKVYGMEPSDESADKNTK